MGDVIDRAQHYDEMYRESAIAVHFAGRRSATIQQLPSDDCEDCGKQIPWARRKVAPLATRCVGCQEKHERIFGRQS